MLNHRFGIGKPGAETDSIPVSSFSPLTATVESETPAQPPPPVPPQAAGSSVEIVFVSSISLCRKQEPGGV